MNDPHGYETPCSWENVHIRYILRSNTRVNQFKHSVASTQLHSSWLNVWIRLRAVFRPAILYVQNCSRRAFHNNYLKVPLTVPTFLWSFVWHVMPYWFWQQQIVHLWTFYLLVVTLDTQCLLSSHSASHQFTRNCEHNNKIPVNVWLLFSEKVTSVFLSWWNNGSLIGWWVWFKTSKIEKHYFSQFLTD